MVLKICNADFHLIDWLIDWLIEWLIDINSESFPIKVHSVISLELLYAIIAQHNLIDMCNLTPTQPDHLSLSWIQRIELNHKFLLLID